MVLGPAQRLWVSPLGTPILSQKSLAKSSKALLPRRPWTSLVILLNHQSLASLVGCPARQVYANQSDPCARPGTSDGQKLDDIVDSFLPSGLHKFLDKSAKKWYPVSQEDGVVLPSRLDGARA